MSSVDAGDISVGESLRINRGDSSNSYSRNLLMRIFVWSSEARGSIMVEFDSWNSP